MYCDFLEFFVFVPRPSSFSVGSQNVNATSSHVQMTSFVNVCDVKSTEKRYACLKIVNNKTKTNDMRFISSMPWVTCGQEKGVLAKGIYFPRGNKSF